MKELENKRNEQRCYGYYEKVLGWVQFVINCILFLVQFPSTWSTILYPLMQLTLRVARSSRIGTRIVPSSSSLTCPVPSLTDVSTRSPLNQGTLWYTGQMQQTASRQMPPLLPTSLPSFDIATINVLNFATGLASTIATLWSIRNNIRNQIDRVGGRGGRHRLQWFQHGGIGR